MRTLPSILYGIRDAFADRKVRGLLAFTLTVIFCAALVFSFLEGWPFLDAMFFAVATISTVGYGDMVPQTVLGRLFCMAYILVGLGIFVAAASAVAEAVMRRREDGTAPERADERPLP